MGLANDMSDVVPTKILQLQIKSEKGESERPRTDEERTISFRTAGGTTTLCS